MARPLLSIICAMDKNRLIGNNNKLPWHLPADLALFKKNTLGKPIVMGRKTFESLGRPLPGRQNIVVTSNPHWSAEGCNVANGIDQALEIANSADEVMLIGGASLYQQTIKIADILYLTLINHVFSGDTWFPQFDQQHWTIAEETFFEINETNSHSFSFIKYIREKNLILK
ncbi:MAG: type 3 dihydrofolate reductase [Gammaproteobacteria bacterium]|nr:type 3 dihydrofolate reductase [Gammaproteobacteria bacterium]